MRLIVIKSGNAVVLDGRKLTVDCSALPDDFHALQWYETWGEVEYITDFSATPPKRKPNKIIVDLTPYQALIDAWRAEDAKPPEPVAQPLPGGMRVIAG